VLYQNPALEQQLARIEALIPKVPERCIPLFDSPAEFEKVGVLLPGPILATGFEKAVLNFLRQFKECNLLNGTFFGYSSDLIRNDCLKHGRADFTTSWHPGHGEGLSPKGKAYLYAYFYMRRHYFEMRQVMGGCKNFLYDHFFNGKAPLLIDLGSGPWTSAFALMDTFKQYQDGLPCTCIGFDRADEMFLLGDEIRTYSGRRVKDTFIKSHDWDSKEARNYLYKMIQDYTPNASVLITASYLFASTSLDAESLGEFIEEIITAAKGRKVCFIETNTTAVLPGNKFHKFVESTPSLQSLFGGTSSVSYYSTVNGPTRSYSEFDEFTGDYIGEYMPPPTSVEFRYMFLGNEALALDSIGHLQDKSHEQFIL
jgi:hypothetical protein